MSTLIILKSVDHWIYITRRNELTDGNTDRQMEGWIERLKDRATERQADLNSTYRDI